MVWRVLSAAKQMGRWTRSQITGQGLILLYHRISDPAHEKAPDIFSLCVTPQHFAEQMELLRESFTPVSLESMVVGIRENNLPNRAIAVTFDDGYADNLYFAKPILEKFKIPATVFVISGILGKEFWWDKLTQIIYQPSSLPNKLDLMIGDHKFSTEINSDHDRDRNILLHKSHRFMRALSYDDKQTAISSLAQWTKHESFVKQNSRPMTEFELKKLAENGLIEIGAHSVTHQPLRSLSQPQQELEITQSKLDLEQILQKPIKSFSYPYGLSSDFSKFSVETVKKANFEYACSNEIDTIWQRSDTYQLPRYWAKDLPGGAFAQYIHKWLR